MSCLVVFTFNHPLPFASKIRLSMCSGHWHYIIGTWFLSDAYPRYLHSCDHLQWSQQVMAISRRGFAGCFNIRPVFSRFCYCSSVSLKLPSHWLPLHPSLQMIVLTHYPSRQPCVGFWQNSVARCTYPTWTIATSYRSAISMVNWRCSITCYATPRVLGNSPLTPKNFKKMAVIKSKVCILAEKLLSIIKLSKNFKFLLNSSYGSKLADYQLCACYS